MENINISEIMPYFLVFSLGLIVILKIIEYIPYIFKILKSFLIREVKR